jgi:hypothetical protein
MSKVNQVRKDNRIISAFIADRDFVSGVVVTLETALQVARKDATDQVTTDPDSYVRANKWQYYCAINTWLLVIADSYDNHPDNRRNGVTVMRHMRDYILHYGLLQAIKHCCKNADAVVACKPRPYNDVAFLEAAYGWGDALGVAYDLQRYRFLKRFTPLKCDVFYDRALADWLDVEKRTRRFNTRQYAVNSRYWYIVDRVKFYLALWTKGYKPVEKWLVSHLPSIPSGSLFTGNDKLDKRIRSISHVWRRPDGQNVLPFNGVPGDLIRGEDTSDWHYQSYFARRRAKKFNRLIFVPKNYKTPRSVAPEQAHNQIMQRAIRDQLEALMPKSMRAQLPCRDQTIMEEACARAFNEFLTTTDFHAASDTFSLRAVIDCYPAVVARDFDRYRPSHTVLPTGVVHTLEQASTMGTGDIWYMMAQFLLACMMVACDIELVAPKRRKLCFAFGDDCIHPDEMRDTFYMITAMFGFIINEDKSYSGEDRFRESCGVEYWNSGTLDKPVVNSVRSIYYPRFPVHCTEQGPSIQACYRDYDANKGQTVITDTLSRFVDLQHRLYFLYPTARDFVTDLVLKLEPRMTVSCAGEDCTDLWGPFEMGAVRRGPGYSDPIMWVNPQTQDEEDATLRTGHLAPVVTCTGGMRDARGACVQLYKYREFLMRGPKAHDPVLKLIGCTESSCMPEPQDMTVNWQIVF